MTSGSASARSITSHNESDDDDMQHRRGDLNDNDNDNDHDDNDHDSDDDYSYEDDLTDDLTDDDSDNSDNDNDGVDKSGSTTTNNNNSGSGNSGNNPKYQSSFISTDTVSTLHEILCIQELYGINCQALIDVMQRVGEELGMMGLDDEELDDVIPAKIVHMFAENFCSGFCNMMNQLGFDKYLNMDL